MHRPLRSRTSVLLTILAASLTAGLAPGPVAQAAEGVKSRVEGSLEVSHTDNLFHYSGARLDEFDLQRDTNPRYAGIESTSDIVSRLGLDGSFEWKLAGKRRVDLDLGVSHFLHADNSLADYTRFRARLSIAPNKRNRFSVGLRHTADRFKKNYLATSMTGLSQWGAANFDQTDLEAGYRRSMAGKRSVEFSWRHRERSFNAMFADRDYSGDYLGAEFRYNTGAKWSGETRAELGQVDSSTGFDGPVLVDRSYDQMRLTQSFSGKVGGGIRLGIEIDYRVRDYSTGVAADDARFDRKDSRLRLRLKGEKKIARGLRLDAGVAWLDNNQDRVGQTLIADETGYEEVEFGAGLSYRF